ncbi:MAG: hypothetical protein WAN13_00175 [Candidatus Acidiferrales bacterium]|jgi:hypothetical protein
MKLYKCLLVFGLIGALLVLLAERVRGGTERFAPNRLCPTNETRNAILIFSLAPGNFT